jgi:hypothetical protein
MNKYLFLIKVKESENTYSLYVVAESIEKAIIKYKEKYPEDKITTIKLFAKELLI